MSVFDEGFNYQFVYQVGSLKGRSLYVSDQYNTDRYAGYSSIIHVCVHKSNKTLLLLHQYNNGSYHLKIGQGKFVNWFIGIRPHPKRKNVFYLVAQPQAYANSYWYFDQIKNTAYDNSLVILKNSYEYNYIGGNTDGHYKRDSLSNFMFLTKSDKIGGSWSSWRVQSMGRSPIYQQIMDKNQILINQIKQKCREASQHLQWYENKSNQYTNTLTQKRNNYANQISNLQSSIQSYAHQNNALAANVNSMEEANRLNLQLIQSRKTQITSLQNQKNILSAQKQYLSQSLQDIRNQSDIYLQQLHNVQGAQQQFIDKIVKDRQDRKQQHDKNINNWAQIHKRYENNLKQMKNMFQQRKKANDLEGEIYDKDEQFTILTDLIKKMQDKNKQYSNKITQNITNYQQNRANQQKQINQEMKLNKGLLQKYIKLKKQHFILKSKTVYFKYLYKQQTNNQPINSIFSNMFGASNYEHQLKQQHQQLKDRLQMLQECFRFHDIEQPPLDNGFLLKQEGFQDNQQHKDQFVQKQKKQQEIKEHEEIRKLDLSTIKGRASKRILKMKKNQGILLNMDDLDQDFQTYYTMRQREQQNRKQKQAKQTHISETAHLFDKKLSTKNNLQINENMVVLSNPSDICLALCNMQLGEKDYEMAVKINKAGGFVGLGIYNIKKILQHNYSSYGYFNHDSDNYYFLTNTGKFWYNDEINQSTLSTNFKFGTGSKILFRYDAGARIISIDIWTKQEKKQTVNFLVKLWHKKSFRIAFLLKGQGCSITTAKTLDDLNLSNKYSQQGSQVILKCYQQHILKEKQVIKAYEGTCYSCQNVFQVGKIKLKCQQRDNTGGLCQQCSILLKQKIRNLQNIQINCTKCISEQIMTMGRGFSYNCFKCKRRDIKRWISPGLNCQRCYNDICYDCAISINP